MRIERVVCPRCKVEKYYLTNTTLQEFFAKQIPPKITSEEIVN